MKPSLTILLCLALFFPLFSIPAGAEENAPADDSGVVLRGVLDLGDRAVFSLSTGGGSGASWVEMGKSFRGFKVVEYEPSTQTLTLEKEGERIELSMAAAVEDAGTDDVGSLEDRLAEADRMMEAIQFEETIRLALDAQVEAMTDMMAQQMAQAAPDGQVDEELIAFQAEVMREMFEGIDWEPIEEGVAEAYAEVFSRDELRGITDFYSTPAGRASIERMPEIQTKTMEVMMPAIMQASMEAQAKMKAYFDGKK